MRTEIRQIEITSETAELFERHKQRFKFGVPESIYDFLSEDPGQVPGEALEVNVRLNGRLAAVSYFDVGEKTFSAIYAMFDPDLSCRGLGIFTMLKEIEFAIASGKDLYYQGYSYEGHSFYDYKKRFRGTEAFDWRGKWVSSEFRVRDLSRSSPANNGLKPAL
jgi:arginine-tRNA-protein transferase